MALWETLRDPQTAGERTTTMGEHGGFDEPASSGGMTEHLNVLLHPPSTSPMLVQDLSSILLDPAHHFQLDLDQAPKAIAAFRQAADQLRDLMVDAMRLANVRPPGLDAVSINVVKEIGQWATGGDSGSLRSALESGAIQLEKTAEALERSLTTHQDIDEVSAAQLRGSEL
jgi:hypothetical protein